MTARTYRLGKSIAAPDYILALRAAHAFGRCTAASFADYDVLLNSPLGTTALRVGELRDLSPDDYVRRLSEFVANTQAANLTGQPAMSVPLAWSATGLPIGIQFTARTGEEATLFRLAGQLEEARPWARLRPAGFP